VYNPKVATKFNQWAGNVWKIWINSFLWKDQLAIMYKYYGILQQLQVMFSVPFLWEYEIDFRVESIV